MITGYWYKFFEASGVRSAQQASKICTSSPYFSKINRLYHCYFLNIFTGNSMMTDITAIMSTIKTDGSSDC